MAFAWGCAGCELTSIVWFSLVGCSLVAFGSSVDFIEVSAVASELPMVMHLPSASPSLLLLMLLFSLACAGSLASSFLWAISAVSVFFVSWKLFVTFAVKAEILDVSVVTVEVSDKVAFIGVFCTFVVFKNFFWKSADSAESGTRTIS